MGVHFEARDGGRPMIDGQSDEVAKVAIEWWRAGVRSEARLRRLVRETWHAYPNADEEDSQRAAFNRVFSWELTATAWQGA